MLADVELASSLRHPCALHAGACTGHVEKYSSENLSPAGDTCRSYAVPSSGPAILLNFQSDASFAVLLAKT